MSEGTKIPLSEAKQLAKGVIIELAGTVFEAIVAGSIRREKDLISDIEVVCIPKPFETGIFESGFAKVVNQWQKVKGEPDGKYTQRILPSGIKLDLFMPDEFDFWRQVAIRTGSAYYSHTIIANGWRDIGWVGTPEGLRLRKECTNLASETNYGEKPKWKCIVANPILPPNWKSEEDFFDWIKVRWIDPKLRI